MLLLLLLLLISILPEILRIAAEDGVEVSHLKRRHDCWRYYFPGSDAFVTPVGYVGCQEKYLSRRLFVFRIPIFPIVVTFPIAVFKMSPKNNATSFAVLTCFQLGGYHGEEMTGLDIKGKRLKFFFHHVLSHGKESISQETIRLLTGS
jgi:hypothetical protein